MRFLIVLISFVVIIFSSCFGGNPATPEGNAVTTEKMSGNWTLLTATRDGDITNTLDSLKFSITSDKIESEFFELLEGDRSQAYTLETSEIKLPNLVKNTFTVKDITDTTLTLQMKIQGHPFELLLGKR